MAFRRKCRTYDDRRNDIAALMATLAPPPIPQPVVVSAKALTPTFDNLPEPALFIVFNYIASVEFYKEDDFPKMRRRNRPFTGREGIAIRQHLKKDRKKYPMNERNKRFWVLKRLYSLTGVCHRWRDVIIRHQKAFIKPTVGCKIMGRPDALFDHRVLLYIYGGKGNKKPTSCIPIEEIPYAMYPTQLVVNMELYDLHLDLPIFDMLMSLDLSKLEKFRFYNILSIDLDDQEKELMPLLVEHLKSATNISFISTEVDPSIWFANEDGSDNVNSVVEGELEKVVSSYTDQKLRKQYRSIFCRKEVRRAKRRRSFNIVQHVLEHAPEFGDVDFNQLLDERFEDDEFGFDYSDPDESDHSDYFDQNDEDMEDQNDEDMEDHNDEHDV